MQKPGLVRLIVTHLLVGPPAGTVTFMGFAVVAALFGSKTAPDGIASFLAVMPMALAAGYVLGAIPAVVASLVAAWVINRTERVQTWFLAAPLIGALASCAGLYWVIFAPDDGSGEKWIVVCGILVTGAIAALVSLFLSVSMTPRDRTG